MWGRETRASFRWSSQRACFNQYARFQCHKELIATLYPLSFGVGPDLLSISAPAPALASPSVSLLAPRLGVQSLGELLPGYTDTIGGSEVLRVAVGRDSVLGGAKASRAWLRLDGSGTVQVTFFSGTSTLATQAVTNSGTNLRMFDPGALFDRLEIRVTSGRVGLKGSGEVLMLALGSATLPCASGYERVGGSCVDINECAGLNHVCDALVTCTNTAGSFSCGPCPSGYRGNGSTACTDIDECAEHTASCSPLVACSNTPGSYTCGACPTGYRGDGTTCTDVDECAEHTAHCDALVTCTNSAGGYNCGACPAGYTGGGDTGCVDVNECTGPERVCDPLVACTNTQGSYTCGTCPAGYRGTGATSCLDIDECAERTATCSPLVACGNTPGGYQCGTCPSGYAGDGYTCTDIDECAAHTDGCDPLVVCTNTHGSYTCGACPNGYSGDGRTCVDIDECTVGAPCDPRTACTNRAGGYLCSACPPGFSGDGFVGCVDIDECTAGTDTCSELVTCGNTLGGYTCSPCPVGYEGDGQLCDDVDECNNQPGLCGSNARCTNVPGSYTCEDCPPGTTADGDQCADIDECATSAPCDPLTGCVNTPGSYACSVCPLGYSGTGYTGCLDVDECAVEHGGCLSDQRCINEEGSFHCEGGCGGVDGTVTSCGLGECRANGTLACVDDEPVDSCVPRHPPVYDAACLCTDKQAKARLCVAGTVNQTCLAQYLDENNSMDPLRESDFTSLRCNGKDDDCNGLVDDGVTALVSQTCGVGDCSRLAQMTCTAGQLTVSCVPGVPQASTDATCNGRDEDCSGAVDEDFVGVATVCGLGACAAGGATTCVGGVVRDSCVPRTAAASDALCNNVDDDCDGRVDEDFVGAAAGTCGVGACVRQGAQRCVAGTVSVVCTPGTPAGNDASCNGIDDDCDGQTDEDFVGTPVACGVGACAAVGTTVCSAGKVSSVCSPKAPAAQDATCDGVDDNCNGVVDEGVPTSVVACAEPTSGCPSFGSLVCAGGQMAIQCTDFGGCVIETSCHDGVDDDGDQRVDCDDTDCNADRGCFEDCGNGVDDDADGDRDCFDSTCASVAPCIAEICGNGLDDDGDLRADCVDPQCAGSGSCAPVPVSAASIATPLPKDPEPTILDQFGFLLEGVGALQQDVTAAFDAETTALVSFAVRDRNNTPLPAVRVSVLDRPEFGSTFTGANGEAEMLVLGGGPLTMEFHAEGMLPVYRKATPGWRDAVKTMDVVMIPPDPHVTPVELDGSSRSQVVRGSIMTDRRGTRQGTLILPHDVTAQMTLPDGSTRPLSAGNVRITEYTVGENGPETMPGELPSNTAYTYAFELSIDEARSVGATRVDFSRPVAMYVENFLNVPHGLGIPLGYFDLHCRCWLPEPDARVVKVVSVSAGMAELDLTGDGTAEGVAALAQLGIDADELRRVAQLYTPGQSLWRMSIPHFTPWDCNAARTPPSDTVPPPDYEGPPRIEEEDCNKAGSIISCANQALGESIPLTGTPYALEYTSLRARKPVASSATIPVTGASVPASLRRVTVRTTMGGAIRDYEFGTAPGQSLQLDWSGLDRFQRVRDGVVDVDVAVCYWFEPITLASLTDAQSSFGAVFSRLGSQGVVLDVPAPPPGGQFPVCRKHDVRLQADLQPATAGVSAPDRLSAWQLDVVPQVSLTGERIEFGSTFVDTAAESFAEPQPIKLQRYQGYGDTLVSVLGDGTSIVAAEPSVVYVGATTSYTTFSLFAVGPRDTLTDANRASAKIGMCLEKFRSDTDCEQRTAAELRGVSQVAFAPEGHIAYLYLPAQKAIVRFDAVRTVAADGRLRLRFVGGRYVVGSSSEASLNSRINFLNDDTTPKYLEDARVARVYLRDGIDGDPFAPALVALDDGSVLLRAERLTTYADQTAANRYHWRVRDNGLAERIDIPEATYGTVRYVTAGPAGSFFAYDNYDADNSGSFANTRNNLLWIQADGTVRRVYAPDTSRCLWCDIGSMVYDPVSDRLIIPRLSYKYFFGWFYDHASEILFQAVDFRRWAARPGTVQSDTVASSRIIHKLQADKPRYGVFPGGFSWVGERWFLLPSGEIRFVGYDDPGTVHDLTYRRAGIDTTQSGRVVAQNDPRTQRPVRYFEYNAVGDLVAIVELNGDRTVLERNARGMLTAVVAPYGQRTEISLDAQSRVVRVADPMGHATTMSYQGTSQFLSTLTDPEGATSSFEFDAQGRLTKDTDALGGVQTLERQTTSAGVSTKVTHTDGDQVKTSFERGTDGLLKRFDVTFAPDQPALKQTATSRSEPGVGQATIAVDRTMTVDYLADDPVAGAQVPYTAYREVSLPSGKQLTLYQLQRRIRSTGDGRVERRTSFYSANQEIPSTALDTDLSPYWRVAEDYTTNETRISSPEGRTVTRKYNAAGQLVELKLPGILPVTYQRNARGLVTSIVQGARVTAIDYGADGLRNNIVGPDGRSVAFARDANGRITQMTTADDSLTSIRLDRNSRLVGLTPADSAEHTWLYTATGDVKQYVAPGGTPQTVGFTNGRRPKSLDVSASDSLVATYRADGKLDKLTTAQNGIYRYSYSGQALASATSPDGTILSISRDGLLVTGLGWQGTGISASYVNWLSRDSGGEVGRRARRSGSRGNTRAACSGAVSA